MNVRKISLTLRHCFYQVTPQIEKLESVKGNFLYHKLSSLSSLPINDAVCNSSVLRRHETNLVPEFGVMLKGVD